jgi:hypothetical protein
MTYHVQRTFIHYTIFLLIFLLYFWAGRLASSLHVRNSTKLTTVMNFDINLSQRYRLKCRELLDTSIGVAPAYHTKIRDEIAIHPDQRTFNNA